MSFHAVYSQCIHAPLALFARLILSRGGVQQLGEHKTRK